ncbi:MAG: hypothetical protein JHC33_02870 [Ignisphaera sp.]|nr:hypothetical protein [Ignisphaera sp.]
MAHPSRFLNGIATQYRTDVLAYYPLPDPIRTGGLNTNRVHTYFNDFDTITSADFTTTGTGTPTFALGSGVAGTAVLTTTTGASDSCLVLKTGTSFGFTSGQQAWYVCQFQLSEVTNSVMRVGLVDTTSNQNGIYFEKATGAGTVALKSVASGVVTTLITSVTTLVAATNVELGLYYNGTDLIVFLNNAMIGRISGLSMAGTAITPTFQLINSTGVARTLTLDYVLVAEETPRNNAGLSTSRF